MKKMQIFEGAVCASDGMCGLSVDQELMRIDTVVKVLQNNAYDIDRYIMPGDRKAFLENEVAGEFLRQNGNEALPLILLDGKMRNPGEIISVQFDGDSFGNDWFPTTFRLNTGVFTRIAIGVVDGGGSALMDNIRLFKSADGIKGDDTYKDPTTGSTATPPTATARPTVTNGSAASSESVDASSAETTMATGGSETQPTEADGTAAATQPSATPSTAVQGKDEVKDDGKPASGQTESTTPWLLIGLIGGGVLLIAAGVILWLILRKKKA